MPSWVNTILIAMLALLEALYYRWTKRKLNDLNDIAEFANKMLKGMEPGVNTYIKMVDDLSKQLEKTKKDLANLSTRHKSEIERRIELEKIIETAETKVDEIRAVTKNLTLKWKRDHAAAEALARRMIEDEKKKKKNGDKSNTQ